MVVVLDMVLGVIMVEALAEVLAVDLVDLAVAQAAAAGRVVVGKK